MTIQQTMRENLLKAGIPAKEVKCYGSQIMVTAWGRDAAVKWADLLGKFATVNAVKESRDYTENTDAFYDANPGLVKTAITHPVWLVWATV